MKKIYSLLSFSFFALLANATVHTVTVANFSFTPANTNAVCGDTIKWIWASGSHTTTSTSVPVCTGGFFSWDVAITSSNPTYTIVVPCAGTYNYECTPHASLGMTGSITVTCANGVSSIEHNYLSTAYPNPFSSRVTIETIDADFISIYNMVGEKIKTTVLQHGQSKIEINTADLKDGIYFYAVIKEGIVIETRKIVKN